MPRAIFMGPPQQADFASREPYSESIPKERRPSCTTLPADPMGAIRRDPCFCQVENYAELQRPAAPMVMEPCSKYLVATRRYFIASKAARMAALPRAASFATRQG